MTELFHESSAQEPPPPTCDGQTAPVAACAASNHDADELILIGPEGETFVLGPLIVDGSSVRSAQAVPPQLGTDPSWAVQVQLTPRATDAFTAATETLLARQIAFVIDGAIVSAPVVQAPITSGAMQVTGTFDEAEARALASSLDPGTDASP